MTALVVSAFIVLQCTAGLWAYPQAAAAATVSHTWTERADFESNASTTGEATSRIQVDTLTTPGDVRLSGSVGAVGSGSFHALGVRADGSVVSAGLGLLGSALNTLLWADIVAVAGGFDHTAGLKSDGTVVVTEPNWYPEMDVSGWTDILGIAAGWGFTVGLKSDGRVLVAGPAEEWPQDTSSWSEITTVAAGTYHALGLKADGTVVATGRNDAGQLETGDWNDVVAIAGGGHHSVGLRSDGTVVAIGDNSWGQLDVSGWTDIVAVAAGGWHTLGLKSDGTVVATGDNGRGQLEIGTWSEISALSTGYYHTVGLRSDGTVVAVGDGGAGTDPELAWVPYVSWAFSNQVPNGGIGFGDFLVGLRVDLGADSGLDSLDADFDPLREGEAVKFGVRLSDDGVTFGEPLGTDGLPIDWPIDWDSGSGTYFGQAYGDGAPRTDLSALPRARYVEIAVLLEGMLGTSPVLHSVTLNASTGPATHIVTFDSNGGTAVPPQVVEHGSFVTTPTPEPTKTGHTFGGWYADAGLTDPWTFETDAVTGATTLYAKWVINTYAVMFDPNGGTPVSPQAVEHGSFATTPTPEPTKTGHTFGGWCADAELTDPWAFETDAVMGETTLYAKWVINTYTVRFLDWDGALLKTQLVEHGSDATAPADPERTGHTFTGWSPADFSNVTGDLTVTAQYQINTYEVRFVDWDGALLKTEVVEHDSDASAPADPERAGHTFTGWDKPLTKVTSAFTTTALYTKDPIEFIRYGGATRYDTAAQAAIAQYPDGALTAIVAYGEDFPDALTSSGLAGVAGAPILLTGTATLASQTRSALIQLGVTKVYIVGGTRVVSGAVESQIRLISGITSVARLWGPTRFETARAIADEVVRLGGSRTEMFLVRGDVFPDALSASSVAAQKRIPILLTLPARLNLNATAFIQAAGVRTVYIAGGTQAVSDAAANAARAAGASTVVRWRGANRYETGAAVINGAKSVWGISLAMFGIASGENFPDALTGGALMGKQRGVLVLSSPTVLSPTTERLLVDNKADIINVQFFGGTAALSAAVSNRVMAVLQ